MSDILIRGMELPKDRGVYIAIDIDGQVYTKPLGALEWQRLEQKAVPVPPHGRCIDTGGWTFPTLHRNPSNDYMDGWNACLKSVHQQPTIIPAEESE